MKAKIVIILIVIILIILSLLTLKKYMDNSVLDKNGMIRITEENGMGITTELYNSMIKHIKGVD